MSDTSSGRLRLDRLLTAPGPGPFLVLVEMLAEGGHDPANIERFLKAYAGGGTPVPPGFIIAGITLPQNPRGAAALSPSDVHAWFAERGLWADLDVIPHITAKDMGVEAVRSALLGMEKAGLSSLLVLTGDKPVRGRGVFDVDSLGLLELVGEMNLDAFRRSARMPFDRVHSFFPLAAVSPFKYTRASQEQQYFKMAKKARAGARAFITQMGWDWRKSGELFQRTAELKIAAPIFGNVFILDRGTPGLRLMVEGKMPGCYVSPELYDALLKENRAASLERAAVQTAMYRDLGAAGIDLGGLTDPADLVSVLARAAEIGSGWRDFTDRLAFGPKSMPGGAEPFYYRDTSGRPVAPAGAGRKARRRFFDFVHRNFLADGRRLNPLLKSMARHSASFRKAEGFHYRWFTAAEKSTKSFLFDCRECGDCHLVENQGFCTLGECGKGLPNVPCGDADPAGFCGNDPDRRCVGELIYDASAALGPAGLKELERTVLPPRDPALAGGASIVNYLLGRDHTAGPGFIPIGENIHATIPKVRAAMTELLAKGDGAFSEPSGALNYLTSMIRAQAAHGARYIDVNVDEFGKDDLELRKGMMRDYVRLVRRHGAGLPVCVDSGSPDCLEAGLEAWYEEWTAGGPAPVKPMINSVKLKTVDRILPLGRKFPFSFIALLVDDESAGREGVYGVDELYGLARGIFEAAVGRYGFQPSDIFFDSTVFPLVIDMPMTENTPGYTYRTFETIRRIRNDRRMKGTHLTLGITNAIRDLPGRSIGVCRAYIARAVEFGLDAAIVNVLHDYGRKPADPELLDFIDAFIGQDGSSEAARRTVEAMKRFCRENRKPSGRK